MLASLTRLLSYWESLRTSFWFLPSIMAVAAIALSSLLVDADIVVTKPVNWQTLIAEMNRLTQQPNAPIV